VPLDTGTTLAALALTGLLGGLGHCTGMCGPLVALAAIKLRERRADHPVAAGASDADRRMASAQTTGVGRRASRLMVGSTVAYHAARIVVYAALGAVVGGIGSLFGLAGGLTTLGAAVSILLGVAVLAMGLGYAGLLPRMAREHGARWWTRVTSWALRRRGLGGAVLLGALNGLLPCGLVYGALLVAAGTGGAGSGSLAMLVFGVATLPALVVIQTGAGVLTGGRRRWLMRVAGVIVSLIGIQLCLRGLTTLGAIPSVHLGRLMLW
jgi:sulfite exporter TauE/SafE